MKENKFQQLLVSELKILFPECVILKNDSLYKPGFPDLTILYKNKWAVLECKKSIKEVYRPNQTYYLDTLNGMSFASMICPENREAVLYELQNTFESRGASCVSKR